MNMLIEDLEDWVLSYMLDDVQDHWFFTDGPNGISSGPAGCHSTNLVEPQLIFAPAYADTDYGYGGETYECTRSAELQLQVRCSDCGNLCTDRIEMDDKLDFVRFLTEIAKRPTRQALRQIFAECRLP